MTATTYGVREGGVLRVQQLSRLDVQILAFITRFGYARGQTIATWTGASGWGVQERLGRLRAGGYANKLTVSVDLLNADGDLMPTTATVWEPTARGAAAVGELVVPGTDGHTVTLPARRPSRAMAGHILGVTDLAAWYHRWGFYVASEREIRSLEMPLQLTSKARTAASYWTTNIPLQKGVHPPDLGVLGGTSGRRWAVELERACKPVRSYLDVIQAYQAAGMGQVWHVLGKATSARLQEACHRAGVTWADQQQPGVLVSADGRVRLQGWRPARAGVDPRYWARQVPTVPPAGFPGTNAVDPTLAWKRGVPVDVDAEQVEGPLR